MKTQAIFFQITEQFGELCKRFVLKNIFRGNCWALLVTSHDVCPFFKCFSKNPYHFKTAIQEKNYQNRVKYHHYIIFCLLTVT